MNQVHLHYTQNTRRLFAVSASGLTVKQLTHYARKVGFLFVAAPHETQLLIGNHTAQKYRLYRALQNAGYDIVVTSGTRDIFPEMKSLDASYFEEETELNKVAVARSESDYIDRYWSRLRVEGDAS